MGFDITQMNRTVKAHTATLRAASLHEFGISMEEGRKDLEEMASSAPPTRASFHAADVPGDADAVELVEEVHDRDGVRVLLVRHGMGHHNDLKGACSAANRDSPLNPVGVQQAFLLGTELRKRGAYDKDTLVVVSPFRRALETASLALDEDAASMPTIVTPLAAEHTLFRSVLQRGDRGSPPAQLREAFPAETYPQYSFTDVEDYCEMKGITKGTWWHHGASAIGETWHSFRKRAQNFRNWLARTAHERGAKKVLVFSHGGLLTASFGRPNYANCGFRHFVLYESGAAFCPSTGEFLPPPSRTPSFVASQEEFVEVEREKEAVAKQLWVDSVRRCPHKVNGHWVYRVEGTLDDAEVVCTLKLSELRRLHDAVKQELGAGYQDGYNLSGMFPAVHWRHGLARGAEEWLHHLCVVMGDAGFPPSIRALVHEALALTDAVASDADDDPESPVPCEDDADDDECAERTADGCPRWVPDSDSSKCNACKARFSVVRRRHHCRICGDVFCSTCSPHRLPLPRGAATAEEQRVCESCAAICEATAHYPPALYVRSSTQPQISGQYELVAWHVNDLPCYRSGPWYLFNAGKEGQWWVSNCKKDFKKGAGVLVSRGEPGSLPHEIHVWAASSRKGTRCTECSAADPEALVTECPQDSHEEWWEVAVNSPAMSDNDAAADSEGTGGEAESPQEAGVVFCEGGEEESGGLGGAAVSVSVV